MQRFRDAGLLRQYLMTLVFIWVFPIGLTLLVIGLPDSSVPSDQLFARLFRALGVVICALNLAGGLLLTARVQSLLAYKQQQPAISRPYNDALITFNAACFARWCFMGLTFFIYILGAIGEYIGDALEGAQHGEEPDIF